MRISAVAAVATVVAVGLQRIGMVEARLTWDMEAPRVPDSAAVAVVVVVVAETAGVVVEDWTSVPAAGLAHWRLGCSILLLPSCRSLCSLWPCHSLCETISQVLFAE